MKEIFWKNVKSKLKAFTLLVKHFRENPLFAKLTQTLTRLYRQVGTLPRKVRLSVSPTIDLSQTKFRSVAAHSYGFTLAELITVIVLLGIVAAVTIPSTIKKHTETVKRTKIKKALETYNAVIQKMVVEHRFKTTQALDDWAAGPDGTCGNAKAYFNIAQTSGNCMFKTHDGIWWYIDSGTGNGNVLTNGKKKVSMSRAIVSFKLSTIAAEARDINLLKNNLYKKASREDYYDTFFFVTTFDDNGSPRIMDLQYGIKKGDWAQLNPSIKVYGFFDKKDIFDYMPENPDCGYTIKDSNGRDVKVTNCCRKHNHDTEKYCVSADGKGYLNRIKCRTVNYYSGNNFQACGGMLGGGANYNPCNQFVDTTSTAATACKNGGIKGTNTGLLDAMGLPYVPLQFNNDNFHSNWSPGCANSLGDDCNQGTVSFSLRGPLDCGNPDPCTAAQNAYNNKAANYLAYYDKTYHNQLYSDKMKAIIAQIGGTSEGYQFSSITTTYYDFNQETGNYSNSHPNNGYIYQSGQTKYSYTNNEGKTITFTIRPDGYIYYTNPDTSVGGNMRCEFNNISNCSVCRTSAEHTANCQ